MLKLQKKDTQKLQCPIIIDNRSRRGEGKTFDSTKKRTKVHDLSEEFDIINNSNLLKLPVIDQISQNSSGNE